MNVDDGDRHRHMLAKLLVGRMSRDEWKPGMEPPKVAPEYVPWWRKRDRDPGGGNQSGPGVGSGPGGGMGRGKGY